MTKTEMNLHTTAGKICISMHNKSNKKNKTEKLVVFSFGLKTYFCI